jgi:hypothetical protein
MQAFLSNAFSLNMLASNADISCVKINTETAKVLATQYDAVSVVGHQETADLFSNELRMPVPCHRETVALSSGDLLIVGQYKGPRLPEGAFLLPEGATIEWWRVLVL